MADITMNQMTSGWVKLTNSARRGFYPAAIRFLENLRRTGRAQSVVFGCGSSLAIKADVIGLIQQDAERAGLVVAWDQSPSVAGRA